MGWRGPDPRTLRKNGFPRKMAPACAHLMMARRYNMEIDALADLFKVNPGEAKRLRFLMEGYRDWYLAEHRKGCGRFRPAPEQL